MPFETEHAADVRVDIEQHYGGSVSDCWQLRDFAYGIFKSWRGRSIETTPDALIASILARSTDTFSCAIHLAT